jgi:hypothetical protein
MCDVGVGTFDSISNIVPFLSFHWFMLAVLVSRCHVHLGLPSVPGLKMARVILVIDTTPVHNVYRTPAGQQKGLQAIAGCELAVGSGFLLSYFIMIRCVDIVLSMSLICHRA